ncbi:MAG: transcriptional regulator NrdR [Candidatus Micrarchaeaceae archaeon]
MKCPYCGSGDVRVVDTRDVGEENAIRRRRFCNACKRRFTTYERVSQNEIIVVKKNGTREQFDRQKIISGIVKACEKRSVSMSTIEGIADKVERGLRSKGVKEIKSRRIGDLVMKELYKIDPVAYIRFASVYNSFDSPDEFKRIASMFKKIKKKR